MRAQILTPTPEHIARAAQSLRQGSVVGMPTETVYGLAGDALNPTALAKIFDTKERPTFDPLIVHVAPGILGSADTSTPWLGQLHQLKLIDLDALSATARARAEALMREFWPGPLTLVLPKHANVPDLATSGLPSVALRMPAHPVAQALIEAAKTPLAAPSANRFGRISPTTAQAVFEELGDRIEWILDGGACTIGVESTVLRIGADGELTLLRPGGLERERIENAIQARIETAASTSKPQHSSPSPAQTPGAQLAPGMLESHYAPVKPLHLLPASIDALDAAGYENILARAKGATQLGFLLIAGDPVQAQRRIREGLMQAGASASLSLEVVSLSPSGDLAEAARKLFAQLRALDASSASVLFSEPCTADRGLGHAIADRLSRASAKRA